MNSVSSTVDLYYVLMKYDIPILKDAKTMRDMSDIIEDMFLAWNRSTGGRSREIADALDWLARSGGDFNKAQLLALDYVRSEMDLDDQEIVENPELDEFYSTFHIVGGGDDE